MLKIVALCILQFAVVSIATQIGCKDGMSSGNCEFYKKRGYCKVADWLKKRCMKTCDLCGTVQTTSQPLTSVTSNATTKSTKFTSMSTTSTTTTTTATTTEKTTTRSTKTTAPNPPVITKIPVTFEPGTCGKSFVKERVIAGRTSKAGQWPWQVNLIVRGHSKCGGSLITPEWVLTAAHCVNKHQAEDLQVILGDLHRSRASSNEQKLSVKHSIFHPHYVRPDNDVALMKLTKPAMLNKYVQTVCLPHATDEVAVGTKCYISGWGKTSPNGFFGSQELQHASLLVLNHTECIQRNWKLATVTERMVCGANKAYARQSGCHGDSGGPFVCQNNDGRFTLHGVVSWGSPKCDISHGATVFAKVAAFRNWIDDVIAKFSD